MTKTRKGMTFDQILAEAFAGLEPVIKALPERSGPFTDYVIMRMASDFARKVLVLHHGEAEARRLERDLTTVDLDVVRLSADPSGTVN